MRRLAIYTSALIVFAVTVGFAVANCQALGLLKPGQQTVGAEHYDGHSHEHPSESEPAVHCPNPFAHFVLSRAFAPDCQQIELRFAAAMVSGDAHDLSSRAYRANHGPPGFLNFTVPQYLFFSVFRI